MITSSALLADLKRQLAALERDLRAQSDDAEVGWAVALRAEHARATAHGRTAMTWSVWRDGEVSQAAVAWLLASTFVRFCEDNHLLDGHPTAGGSPVWIAGPGDRTARAVEAQQAHYEARPTDNSRDWLHRAFHALADLPAGRGLVDPDHNPVWRLLISAPAADALVAFWRQRRDDGSLAHDFTDPALDTRFLGDLYQELSEYAKKTYALLQTPVFVEEFILDRTLTPAIEEFGLPGLRLVDPTCGSGHFLLGAFARLDAAWQADAPGLTSRERVQKALDSIHGVDLNPFAVAIARFRLTVAALQARGDTTLTLHDVAVSTSGPSQLFVVIDGVRYSHVIDPRSGRPLTTPFEVTVLHHDPATADALATAVTVLGADEGARLAAAHGAVLIRRRD